MPDQNAKYFDDVAVSTFHSYSRCCSKSGKSWRTACSKAWPSRMLTYGDMTVSASYASWVSSGGGMRMWLQCFHATDWACFTYWKQIQLIWKMLTSSQLVQPKPGPSASPNRLPGNMVTAKLAFVLLHIQRLTIIWQSCQLGSCGPLHPRFQKRVWCV